MGSCCSWLTARRQPLAHDDGDARASHRNAKGERPLLADDRGDIPSKNRQARGSGGKPPIRGGSEKKPSANNNNTEPQKKRTAPAAAGTSTRASSTVPSSARNMTSAAMSLRDYELIAFIGNGTFAEVTLARHRTTHEHFAIKKVSKRKVEESGGIERAVTERRLLGALYHPFLVTLHQAFQSRDYLYLVLDFAQGGDFYDFLVKRRVWKSMLSQVGSAHHHNRRFGSGGGGVSPAPVASDSLTTPEPTPLLGSDEPAASPQSASTTLTTSPPPQQQQISPLPEEQQQHPPRGLPVLYVYYYAVEIALILSYIHDQGFIYRDLKPENILLRADGHVMLTDFGVAKNTSASTATAAREGEKTAERVHSFVGTAQYMSPEMLQGMEHGAETDWWSFGCLLFELCNGRRPFDELNEYKLFKSIVEQPVAVQEADFQLQPHDFFVPTSLSGGGGAAAASSSVTDDTQASFYTNATTTKSFGDDSALPPSVAGESTSWYQSSSSIQLKERPFAVELDTCLCELKALCDALLQKDQRKRLGYGPGGGKRVLEHPFFHQPYLLRLYRLIGNERHADPAAQVLPTSSSGNIYHPFAQQFLAYAVRPPFLPKLRGQGDLRYFPNAITISSILELSKSTAAVNKSTGVEGKDGGGGVVLAEAEVQRKRHELLSSFATDKRTPNNVLDDNRNAQKPSGSAAAAASSSSAAIDRKNTSPSDELYDFMLSLTETVAAEAADRENKNNEEDGESAARRRTLRQRSQSSVLDYYDDCDFILPSSNRTSGSPSMLLPSRDDDDDEDEADDNAAASGGQTTTATTKQRRGASVMGGGDNRSSIDSGSTAGFLWGAKYDDEFNDAAAAGGASKSSRPCGGEHYPGFTFDGRAGRNFLDLA